MYDGHPSDCFSGLVVGQLDTLQVVLVANEELTVGVGREAPSFAADLHSIQFLVFLRVDIQQDQFTQLTEYEHSFAIGQCRGIKFAEAAFLPVQFPGGGINTNKSILFGEGVKVAAHDNRGSKIDL